MFELNEEEMTHLKSQIGASIESEPVNKHGGTRYSHFAFTELGVAMLSSILRNNRAIQINIAIMRAFIELRKSSDFRHSEINPTTSFNQRLTYIEDRLEIALNQIQALSKLNHQNGKIHSPHLEAPLNEPPSIEQLQQSVAKYFGIQERCFKEPKREKTTSIARHISIYLIRKYLRLSFKEIGRHFGDRDHTTALYAFKKIELGMKEEAPFKGDVLFLQRALEITS
jgi:hypothetical protein